MVVTPLVLSVWIIVGQLTGIGDAGNVFSSRAQCEVARVFQGVAFNSECKEIRVVEQKEKAR